MIPPTPAPAGTGTAEPYSGKVLDAAKLEALLGEARYIAEKPRRPGRSAIMANTEASWARSLLDAVATLTRQLAEAEERSASAARVHLARHARLSEALGVDAGYSADATVDEAIKRARQLAEAQQREQALTTARDAWREYAEHAAGCVECGEMSWESCDDGPHGPGGKTLREAALTADIAARVPTTLDRDG